MDVDTLLTDKKFRWIARIYFHLSSSPNYELNKYEEQKEFLLAPVGSLSWGEGKTRTEKKAIFCKALSAILALYEYKIPVEELMNVFSEEKLSNAQLIQKLSAVGTFPQIK